MHEKTSLFGVNIEDLTLSKINVLLCLAPQFEALVILLQETPGKLVLPSFIRYDKYTKHYYNPIGYTYSKAWNDENCFFVLAG